MKIYNINSIQSKVNVPKKPSDEYVDGLLVGGYRYLKECISQTFNDAMDSRNNSQSNGHIIESDIENNSYLHALESLNYVNKNHINIVELGMGYAAPSLTLSGLIDNTNMFPNIKTYKVLGIEGEKNHFKWSEKCISEQIKGEYKIINGAITTFDGEVGFMQGNSADNYGQAIGSGESVKSFRLETLLNSNNIEVVDILHMDIQGEEINVIKDSVNLFSKINFMYIGTHSKEIHKNILEVLDESNKFDILFNVPIHETTYIPEFGTIEPYEYMDGLIFCQNKNII